MYRSNSSQLAHILSTNTTRNIGEFIVGVGDKLGEEKY